MCCVTRAALAAGAHGLFIETHMNPAIAKSDAASMLSLKTFEALLPIWNQLYQCVRSFEMAAV